jgi:ribonuclease HI
LSGGNGGERAVIAVYADESCLGNGREGDNPGGAGGLIECLRLGSGELARFDYWVSDPATTNNRMALRSVIEAFRILGAKGRTQSVVFTSDSNYIVKGMKEWMPAWRARGWTRKGGSIENLELWREAESAVAGHRVEWNWVRGHDGHAQNEYANDLAIRAARELTSSNGAVDSAFDAWLAAKTAKGKMRAPTPFPPAPFRAALPVLRG